MVDSASTVAANAYGIATVAGANVLQSSPIGQSWWVDGTNGNDANSGTDALHPKQLTIQNLHFTGPPGGQPLSIECDASIIMIFEGRLSIRFRGERLDAPHKNRRARRAAQAVARRSCQRHVSIAS